MARSTTLMGAVEDLEEEGLAEGVNDETVEVPGEVRDAEDEVTGGEETLDGAEDDIETLEEVKDILDDAADNGEGIDETAAKIVEATVEKIYARLGIQSASVMGSMESFKNQRSRVTATRMAAEDIGGKVSRAWEAVKKFFRDLWEKIKGLWKKYATAVGRLKTRAMAMRTKVGKAGATKKEESFDSKEYAHAFNDKSGAFILGDQLENTFRLLRESDSNRDELVGMLDEIEKADKSKLNKAKKALADKLAGIHKSNTAESGKIGPDIDARVRLVGNRAVAFYLDESEDKFTLDVFEVDAAGSDRTDESVKVEDKKDLVDDCAKIIQICDQIDRNKDKISKNDKRVMAKLDEMGKATKGDDKDAKGVAMDAKVARELLRANGKMSYLPEKIAIAGCHKALSYVGRCVGMYEK